jgi:hypothetical protein
MQSSLHSKCEVPVSHVRNIACLNVAEGFNSDTAEDEEDEEVYLL